MMKLSRHTSALFLCYLLGFGPLLTLAAEAGARGTAARVARGAKATAPEPVRPPAVRAPRALKARAPQAPTAGQASTLLPDGRTLVTGGQGAEGPQSGVFIVEAGGAQAALGSGLRSARAFHTATLLPDGRVLVVGGLGAGGQVVEGAEIYDPQAQSSEPLASAWPGAARAHHTATLLTDGRVLVVGGTTGGGRLATGAELWDFRTKRATVLRARPNVARQRQKAALLESGAVVISGGTDEDGNEASGAELFNPEDGGFSFTAGAPADPGTAYVSASIPANEAGGVATDAVLSLRFSRPLRVETVNAQSVTLHGPQGPVAARVVPAEGGRLAFVTPLPSLERGTSYTLSVAGAADGAGTVAPATIAFTTEGRNERAAATDEDWVPGEHNFRGNWRSNRLPETPAMSLPPLDAPEGVTALSGQVLALNGHPLSGVTFRVGDVSVRSDSTGRFLLAGLPAGHHVMVMDGRTASTPAKRYGIFKVGVDTFEGKTSRLGYTVWMPKLDTANAVRLPSPTAADTVVTSPRIPGLELRLPAGTAIRDMDGATVTEVSVTPIPTNQPPFPLPAGVDVPVYFTVQPGGASLIPPRAQLVYPNFMGAAAGARIDFYNYDAAEKGWYVYGKGTVTADRRQIMPDAGVVLYEFSGAMVANPSNAPPDGPPPCAECEGGDPVDLSTGLFVYDKTDLAVGDILPVSLTRTYRPRDTVSRPFGLGTTHPYEIFIVGSIWPYTYADLILPDGGRVHYNRISPGTSFGDAVYEHTETPSVYYKTQIRYVGGRWHLTLKDGTVYEFPDAENVPTPRQAALVAMSDRHGNRLTLTRDGNSNLTRIETPSGRYIDLAYDASNRITQAKDNIGRTVGYAYDASGRLSKVTDPAGAVTEYGYDNSNRMTTVKDGRAITYITNAYDTAGRVIKQTMADGSVYQFAYATGSNGRVSQTDLTDQRGNVRRVNFNASGYMLTDTYAVGKPEQQVFTYEREAGTNRTLSVTDPLGRKTAFGYDAEGRATSVTKLAGRPGAVTTSMTYGGAYSLISTLTDALGHTSSLSYDAKGNLVSATDPLGKSASFTYNGAGQLTSFTDKEQNTTRFTYDGGDLVSVTDPLGRTSTRFVDDAGRALSITNALGHVTKFEYDALNRPTRVTEPAGGTTSFTYDGNGNLLTLTDARGNVTAYTYDNMDRVASRKDALLRTETYQYDLAGNLTRVTDRRGKLTTYAYDALNRQTFTGFGAVIPNRGAATYESSITLTYDGGDRLTRVDDTTSGAVTLGYDDLDRLVSEVTPRGSVAYTYDAAARRTGMTVAGQQPVAYGYDNANRLTSLTQGANVVNFTYDDANRPATLRLPNNMVVEYAYDRASQMTGLTYKKDGAVVGNLSYTYDGAGRRVRVGGTFARSAAPLAFTSASYNANNQLTQRGASAFTYDANGNLTGDGVNTYTWDARNRLSAISGGTAATFLYDSFGRRVRRSVGGVATDYLYDGHNAVQELSGTTPVANMLTGGTDEVFTRTDAAGTRAVLADGLGSTLSLADDAGALRTEYTYDPFGATASAGDGSANASQFTGRENDGTGLYYYRARYYSPALQRFVSEDPIGFGGGDTNLYAYVGNNPTNVTDSSGMFWDTLLDVGFIGYDLYKLFTGGRKDFADNAANLGLDVLGAALPFVTGLGAARRGLNSANQLSDVARGSYKELSDAGLKDAHHIIQDAAVRDLPGYSRNSAPAVQLPGPANDVNSPHGRTRPVQRERGGGNYAAERRIGYKALRRAGISKCEARDLINYADDYFNGLGVGPQTPTRIPGDRR